MNSHQVVYHNKYNTYNMYNVYMYNITIGIAQLNTFRCAKNMSMGAVLIWTNANTVVNIVFQEILA